MGLFDFKPNDSKADKSDDPADYFEPDKDNYEKAKEARDRYNAKYCSSKSILPPPRPHPDFELHPDDVEIWAHWEPATYYWPQPHEIPDDGIFEPRYPGQPESQPPPQNHDSMADEAGQTFGNPRTHQPPTQTTEDEATVEHVEHKENPKESEMEELLKYMRLNDPEKGGAQPVVETDNGNVTPPATPQPEPEPTIHSPTAAAAEALRDNSTRDSSPETP